MNVRIRWVLLTSVFIILIVLSFNFMLASRTKVGYAYDNIHPWFMPTFLITILLLAALIVSRRGSKVIISFIIAVSLMACLFYSIVYDGGPGWDSWVHLGFERQVYDDVSYDAYGLPWLFSFRMPGGILSKIYYATGCIFQYSLSVVFARIFSVDIYWVHLLVIPALWGAFVPVIAYSIGKSLYRGSRVGLVSGFLAVSISTLILWASVSVPASLGYLLFFLALYMVLQYLSRKRSIFPAVIIAFASFIAHYVPGIFSFAVILLAYSFKKYQASKHERSAIMQLIIGFVFCVALLPFANAIQGYFYPIYGGFTLSKVSELPAYDAIFSLIFTEYEKYTIREFIAFGGVVILLGFTGLVINNVLKNKKVDKQLSLFILLVLLVILIDVRVMVWFMAGILSPKRIWTCAELIAVPSAGVLITRLIDFLSPLDKGEGLGIIVASRKSKLRIGGFNVKKAFVMMAFVGLLSGMVAVSVYKAGSSWPNLLTGYDIEAAKYIDEATPHPQRYVVICDTRFLLAGYSVVGIRNPRAFYAYEYDRADVLGLFGEMVSNPSPEIMVKASVLNNASYQYFVVTTSSPISYWHTTLSKVIEMSSLYFDQFGVFGDGEYEVYVFRYRVPPFPYSSDVSAFYWDEPTSYIIQNDLMRVLIPQNKSIELRHPFEGKLYEAVDFGKTLVDGKALGNVSAVEYFDSYEGAEGSWVKWDVPGEVAVGFAMKQQFTFRLVFDEVRLVATVERGKPFVQLRWESLDGGSHSVAVYLRTEQHSFVVPGLTDAENPGGVGLRKYGTFYTVSRTENVSLHYAYNYEASGMDIYPYRFQDDCGFYSEQYTSYDLFVDNEASFGRWVYLEVYLPDVVSGSLSAPVFYSIDGGENWEYVGGGRGPLKTVNGTEVNWVVSGARQWAEEPKKWSDYLGVAGGKYEVPASFIDSGGAPNRIIFGLYLLGDTNTAVETFSGDDEGDQALIRIGVGEYRDIPFETTYAFEDSDDVSCGLRNMDDVFLTFATEGVDVGGVTFTERLDSLFITANREDEIDCVVFNVSVDTDFALLAEFSESAVYESLARLSYIISETDNEISLMAMVTSENEWGRPATVTISIPSNYSNEGGEFMFTRGLSDVYRVEVINGNTESMTIYR